MSACAVTLCCQHRHLHPEMVTAALLSAVTTIGACVTCYKHWISRTTVCHAITHTGDHTLDQPFYCIKAQLPYLRHTC
jgi:hypothetical protein